MSEVMERPGATRAVKPRKRQRRIAYCIGPRVNGQGYPLKRMGRVLGYIKGKDLADRIAAHLNRDHKLEIAVLAAAGVGDDVFKRLLPNLRIALHAHRLRGDSVAVHQTETLIARATEFMEQLGEIRKWIEHQRSKQ